MKVQKRPIDTRIPALMIRLRYADVSKETRK